MFFELATPVALAAAAESIGWTFESCEIEGGCEAGADNHWGSTLERKSPLLKLITGFMVARGGAPGAPNLRLRAAPPRAWHEATTASCSFLYTAT